MYPAVGWWTCQQKKVKKNISVRQRVGSMKRSEGRKMKLNRMGLEQWLLKDGS